MIPIAEPSITEKEIAYVLDAVKSGWVSSTGRYVQQFEQQFADYIGTQYALAVSNGTTKTILIVRQNINLSTNLVTITHSFITSVTYELQRTV